MELAIPESQGWNMPQGYDRLPKVIAKKPLTAPETYSSKRASTKHTMKKNARITTSHHTFSRWHQ